MNDPCIRKNPTVFTIGHSNHSIETFVDLLTQHDIDVVVDVRSSPYCHYCTWYNRESFEQSMKAAGLEYLFLGSQMGGRPAGTRFYDADGCVLYAELAESSEFKDGVARLLNGIEKLRMVLLCGEEDPMHCHRRVLIGRVLAKLGVHVIHVRGDGSLETEKRVAAREEYERTGGQLDFLAPQGEKEWKSTQSVLPKRAQENSSGYSDPRR